MKKIIEALNENLNLKLDKTKIKTPADLYEYCKNNHIEGNIPEVIYRIGKINYKLALIYETDEVLKNNNEAFNYYLKAAEYESLPAQAMLTQKYYFGKNGKRDYDKALYWGNRILDNIDKMNKNH